MHDSIHKSKHAIVYSTSKQQLTTKHSTTIVSASSLDLKSVISSNYIKFYYNQFCKRTLHFRTSSL